MEYKRMMLRRKRRNRRNWRGHEGNWVWNNFSSLGGTEKNHKKHRFETMTS